VAYARLTQNYFLLHKNLYRIFYFKLGEKRLERIIVNENLVPLISLETAGVLTMGFGLLMAVGKCNCFGILGSSKFSNQHGIIL
jgi:hypothetical protein